MKTSSFRCLLGLVVTLLYLPQVVFSAGVVNSATDAALRAALAGGGTVTFNCEGTITLTGTVAIASSTVLDGTGHVITLSGGNAVQLFSINSGVNAAFINLTLANGYAAGSNGVAGPPVTDGQPGQGGAIFNNGGIVVLDGCTVVSNNAVGGAGYTNSGLLSFSSVGGVGLGGAVYNLAGNLSVTNCSFSANGAAGGNGGYWLGTGSPGGDACGGAICSQGGSVVVQNSTFVSQAIQGGAPGGNSLATISHQGGSGLGGAIWTSNATASFYSSTFTSNFAVGGSLPYQGADSAGSGKGGAIFAANGVLNCVGCAFTTNSVSAGSKPHNGNVGSAQGGAIWSQASLSVSQSSFFGNQAIGNGGGASGPAGEGDGGAIFAASAISLSGSLFANNQVIGAFGGYVLTSDCSGGMGKAGPFAIWEP